MPTFIVRQAYDARTWQRSTVEADSIEEAMRIARGEDIPEDLVWQDDNVTVFDDLELAEITGPDDTTIQCHMYLERCGHEPWLDAMTGDPIPDIDQWAREYDLALPRRLSPQE